MINPFIVPNQSIAQLKNCNQNTIVITDTYLTSQEVKQHFQKYTQLHQNAPYVFILFSDKQTAAKALEKCVELKLNASFISEVVQVDYTISVINIPLVQESQLKTYFEIFGSVLYARILRDQERESLGFGYVTFGDATSYNKAIQAKTLPVDELIIYIHEKLPVDQMDQRLKIIKRSKLNQERKGQKYHKAEEIQNLKFLPKVDTNLEVIQKNEMRTAGRILRKKIKKYSEAAGDDQFALVKRMKQFKNTVQQKQDEFFKLPSQLRARRQYRKTKAEENRKKANKLHKLK